MPNKNELEKELEKRGTAEISNGQVLQVTQALDEQTDKVKLSIFGEIQEKRIMPIDKACSKCPNKFYRHFKSIKDCQERQKKDALARGFTQLICPEQFIEE